MKLETRQAVAEALGFGVTEMDREVLGQETAPYLPPESAHVLSFRNRRLVDQLINALADAEQGEAVDHHVRDTSNKRAAGSAATDDIEDELAARRKEPHRRRRPGHDPEWDELYGGKKVALEGDPDIAPDELPDDST